MKVIAVIPVKTVSERVESKNFREFINGKSLFDILTEISVTILLVRKIIDPSLKIPVLIWAPSESIQIGILTLP